MMVAGVTPAIADLTMPENEAQFTAIPMTSLRRKYQWISQPSFSPASCP
jgi:hypothetical protein